MASNYTAGSTNVGWVAVFDPTDPNANSLYGVATLSILGEEMAPILCS
jgi:hypothetical protein